METPHHLSGEHTSTPTTGDTQEHIPLSLAAEASPTAPKDDRNWPRSGSIIEAATHSHEGSENARNALSGFVGALSGGVGGVPAASTRKAQEEGNIIIVADDSAASYGASETTLRR